MAIPQPIPFGDYKPDLPPLINDGLVQAKNTIPTGGGYKSIRALSAVSSVDPLAECVC